MTDVEWNPEGYVDRIVAEIPAYHELEERVAACTVGVDVVRVLDLGVGTGETARRVLAVHPGAHLVGIDASPEMLARAREELRDADLRLQRLEDALPAGPFDLVVSALAVHHLDADGKRDLFRRVADVVRPGGWFVLGDVVVPERAEDARIEIDWDVDLPDRAVDQVAWLRDAGFSAAIVWEQGDLAVLRADR